MPASRRSTRRAGHDPLSDEALFARPPELADAPDMPISIAVLEHGGLAKLARKHGSRLAAIGIAADQIALMGRFPKRLQGLERDWQKARNRGLPAGLKKQQDEAERLKRKLLGGGEWACRKDQAALAILAAIRQGTGLADTINDLVDLYAFWNARPGELKHTKITRPDLGRASHLADTLSEAATDQAADTDAAQAYELRNRCFWAASELASEIRQGGRYAFDDTPKIAARFVSRYRVAIARRARRTKRAKKGAAGDPLSEVAGV